MPIVVEERVKSRRFIKNEAIELLYWMRGTDDPDLAMEALLSDATGATGAPPTMLAMNRGNPDIEYKGGLLWYAKVRYVPGRPIRLRRAEPETGDYAFEFSAGGRTQHITQSLETISLTVTAGGTPSNLKGAIGLSLDKKTLDGVDIQTAHFSFASTLYVDVDDMTTNYMEDLRGVVNHVNNAQFSIDVSGVNLTFAAGELYLASVTGRIRSGGDDWELRFNFQSSPNRTGITVGDMTGISKKGFEYLWVRYTNVVDANLLIPQPYSARVERVYETATFTDLTPPP